MWPSPRKVPWNELVSSAPTIAETLMLLFICTYCPLKVQPPVTALAKPFQSSVLLMMKGLSSMPVPCVGHATATAWAELLVLAEPLLPLLPPAARWSTPSLQPSLSRYQFA